jgi:hypothetical protein
VTSAREFADRYRALLEVVNSLTVLCGFCYTQFADTYQEANGLLYADRTPKIPIEQIRRATRANRPASGVEFDPLQAAGLTEAID